MKNERLSQFKQLGLTIAYYRKLKGYTQQELAEAFIDELSTFVHKIGLPGTLKEMDITLSEDVKTKIAETAIRTAGCVKKFDTEELREILTECE